MKIFFINAVCGMGSTGRIVTDIAHLLQDNGDDFYVAYSHGTARNIDDQHVCRIGSRRDYYIHNMLSRITDYEGGFSRKATRQLIEKIQDFNPDVIHIHNTHGHWLNHKILFQYLKNCGKKIIWTLHDCWAFTGHCAHFTYAGCDKWRTGCRRCPQLKGYPHSYGVDRSKKNYKEKQELFTVIPNMTIVTPSDWLANLVRESYLGKYPVKVINNGLDMNMFKPTEGNFRQRYGLEKKRIILGVASVWMEKKGFFDFLKLADMLDEQSVIVLVGVTLKQQAMLPANMIGIIHTENVEELTHLYTTADVFVNLSYEETMGLVTVEALACGTPAIVYDATAVPEVVDEASGVVVKTGDLQGIIDAIKRLDKQQYPLVRKRAARFERKLQYSKYLQLYHEQHEK